MAFQFHKGVEVQQVAPVLIKGRVSDYRIDGTTGERQIGVEWYDAQNQHHERFFNETEIELVSTPVATEKPK